MVVFVGCKDDDQLERYQTCKPSKQNFKRDTYSNIIAFHYNDENQLASHLDETYDGEPIVNYLYENGKLTQLKTDSARAIQSKYEQ